MAKKGEISVIEGEVLDDDTSIAGIRHIDENDSFAQVHRQTRLAMNDLKRKFWKNQAELLSNCGTEVKSWSKLAKLAGYRQKQVYYWKNRYEWFEHWLLTPDAATESKLKTLYGMVFESVMKDLEQNKLDPRAKIVLMTEISKQLAGTDDTVQKLGTADIIKAMEGAVERDRSKNIEKYSSQARGRKDDLLGDGAEVDKSSGDIDTVCVSTDGTTDDG